jgi:hypothetical protein
MENKGNKTNYPIWEKLNGTHEKDICKFKYISKQQGTGT